MDLAPTEGGLAARALSSASSRNRRLAHAGLRLEDKGPIQALHWRTAADVRAAEGPASEVAAGAGRPDWSPAGGEGAGEAGRRGATRGRRSGVARRERIDRAPFAGDDRTDLDAFRPLRALRGGQPGPRGLYRHRLGRGTGGAVRGERTPSSRARRSSLGCCEPSRSPADAVRGPPAAHRVADRGIGDGAGRRHCGGGEVGG